MKRIAASLFAVALGAVLVTPSIAAGSVTLKIGSTVGAAHDTIGRLVGRHLGKFLAGNPEIVVENVGGGGGVLLARQIENTEPSDGSVIGLTNAGIITTSILTPDKAPFHSDKVKWIGSMGLLPSICTMTNKSGFSTIADLVADDDAKLGVAGTGSKNYVLAQAIRHLYGANFQVVQGFNGMAEVRLAMERGEIDGVCGVTLTTFISTGFSEFAKVIGTFDPNVIYKGTPIPLVWPSEMSDADRQAVAVLVADEQIFSPFMVPGATDPSIVAALRKAFNDMAADPEFQADADQVILDMKPTTGEEVEALVTKLLASDPAILDRARQLAE